MVRCQAQALLMMSSSRSAAVQPRRPPAIVGSAKTATGSPARRGPYSWAPSFPEIRSVASMISITCSDSGADVQRDRLPAAGEVVERAHVGVGEVVDVDVVADRSAVGSRVVVAEHLDRRPPAERRLHHQRHEVQRVRPVLADVAAGCWHPRR